MGGRKAVRSVVKAGPTPSPLPGGDRSKPRRSALVGRVSSQALILPWNRRREKIRARRSLAPPLRIDGTVSSMPKARAAWFRGSPPSTFAKHYSDTSHKIGHKLQDSIAAGSRSHCGRAFQPILARFQVTVSEKVGDFRYCNCKAEVWKVLRQHRSADQRGFLSGRYHGQF